VGRSKANIPKRSPKNNKRQPRVSVTRRMRKNGSERAFRINLIPCQMTKIMAMMVMISAVWTAV
jgi:hypothetical protein